MRKQQLNMNKQKMKSFLAVIIVLMMIAAMCGCGAYEAEADEIFSGEIVDAQNERIVVRGADETMLFVTTDDTQYDLKEESEICIGDIIEVDYHKGDDMYIADTVRLTSHKNNTPVFGGEVTELKKTYLTVQSESLTAVFRYDKETKTEGDLSQGDAVTITYEGGITENPRAVSIVVIQEKKEQTEKSLHGTVSEVGEKSAVISVDSAHACRMGITADTTFSGDDTKLKIGDEVNVVYTGSAEDSPVAKSIRIRRNKQQIYYVMDGVIETVSANGIVVRTSQNAYTFGIEKETRIQNPDYMKAGHKTTITYVGELEKTPVAASIFCSKDTVTDKEKQKAAKEQESTKSGESSTTEKTTQSKDSKKTEGSTQSKDTAKSNETTETKDNTVTNEADNKKNSTENKKSSNTSNSSSDEENTAAVKKSGTAEPESVLIKASGEIEEWTNPCTIKTNGSGTLKLDIIDASVSGGYIPQAGDQVLISYDKDTMKLIEMQLEYRPVKEEEQSDTSGNNDSKTNKVKASGSEVKTMDNEQKASGSEAKTVDNEEKASGSEVKTVEKEEKGSAVDEKEES